jgi:hypothetical protein
VRDCKTCERHVADLRGGKRMPIPGQALGNAPHVELPRLAIEYKSRRRLSALLQDALSQAEASVKDGQLPVAGLHQDGRHLADSLVVLRFKAISTT